MRIELKNKDIVKYLNSKDYKGKGKYLDYI